MSPLWVNSILLGTPRLANMIYPAASGNQTVRDGRPGGQSAVMKTNAVINLFWLSWASDLDTWAQPRRSVIRVYIVLRRRQPIQGVPVLNVAYFICPQNWADNNFCSYFPKNCWKNKEIFEEMLFILIIWTKFLQFFLSKRSSWRCRRQKLNLKQISGGPWVKHLMPSTWRSTIEVRGTRH